MATKTAMRQIEVLASSRVVAPAALTRRQLLLGTAVGALAMATTVRPARPQDDESDLVIVNGWVLRMDDVRPR